MEIAGQTVHAGEYIWFWIAAANRDPRQFPHPDVIDPYRVDTRHVAHLAFGSGAHYCLGAALAQLELQLALATMSERYPHLQVLDPKPAWRNNVALRGLESLHVSLR